MKIKNYDVFVVRIIQIILSILSSYIILVLIVLVADRKFINPQEFVDHILLFDANPIGLTIGWGATIVVAAILLGRSAGQKIKDSSIMKTWLGLKNWVLSLGRDFE